MADQFLDRLSAGRPITRGGDLPTTELVLLVNKLVDVINANFSGTDSAFLADFVVGAANATLTNERVLTNTTRVTWDIGTDNQVSADVETSATDVLLGRSSAGGGSVEEIACTSAGRALLDDATAADQRTTLGLGTMSVAAKSSATYTPTNVTTSRSFDANAAAGAISVPPTQAEVENIRDAVLALADVVGTLIADAQAEDWIQ